MDDDQSDAERRSLAEWAAKDGGAETAADAAAQAAQAAEAAKAAEIFAAGKEGAETGPGAQAGAATEAEAVAQAAAEAAKDAATARSDDEGTTEPAKPKKVAKPLEGWIKDRFGELTAKQRDAERLAAEAKARADVAEAELAELRKRGSSGDTQPAKDTPAADFVPRTQVEARAAEIARMNAFNAQADQAFFAGKAAYKDFEDALQPLQAMGALNRMDFQEAALATGAAHDVLYELGSDPDKASEILGDLKAGRTAKAAAAMTRVADSVAARKASEAKAEKGKKTPTSAVPAPIRPVGGSALPVVDLEKADDQQFDAEFSKVMKRIGWN